MKDQASKPKSAHSRGRWDGAISPRTPGFMPPLDTLPAIELPKLPGGGGVFKCAAVAVLREEKRLMSTGAVHIIPLHAYSRADLALPIILHQC